MIKREQQEDGVNVYGETGTLGAPIPWRKAFTMLKPGTIIQSCIGMQPIEFKCTEDKVQVLTGHKYNWRIHRIVEPVVVSEFSYENKNDLYNLLDISTFLTTFGRTGL